jgi:GcrA cell cycle regulator
LLTARRRRRRVAALPYHPSPPTSPKKAFPIAELGPAPQIPVTIATLTADTCRWPEGDPKTPGFHFCGRLKSSSPGPYCGVHTTIARTREATN